MKLIEIEFKGNLLELHFQFTLKFLIKLKINKYSQSDEAKNMEEKVHKSSDWAVRIKDVSRLKNKPIAAVNNVSLDVKEFSIFGILGANGAGKTIVIRMITGMLPQS